MQNLKSVWAVAATVFLVAGSVQAQTGVGLPSPVGSRTSAEKIEVPLTSAVRVVNSRRSDLERDFLEVAVPEGLDSVYLDVAEIVLTVSTVYDTTESLIITAAPVTSTSASQSLAASGDWEGSTEGFDAEYLEIALMNMTTEATEIRLDVTQLLRRWMAGDAPNYGVVIKSVSENKSTFSWIRDGRYNGADAKLVILYSRL